MGDWSGYLLVVCLLSISSILMLLSVMAFSEPFHFVRWFTPLYWFSRRIGSDKKGVCDRVLASAVGAVCFGGLLFVSFLLGGWFVTAFFGLFNSPFAPLVFPR
jgi:hypothetical protein